MPCPHCNVVVAAAVALASVGATACAQAQTPFAIVDKAGATIAVHHADGTVAGRSQVLLGSRLGDASQPGVGWRTQVGQLRPDDRTTPAGRFVSSPGRNRSGEAVVWLDYDGALAIHRLRPGRDHADRARRLASDDPARRRVSAGCVVVPAAFFDGVVQPLLGRGAGVVYVLPEAAAPPFTRLARASMASSDNPASSRGAR